MASIPLAERRNFFHLYDFRVKPGMADAFVRLFDEFDYSNANPMHQSSAQVKDGVLCQDVSDPLHFWLIGEWRDIEIHARIRKVLAEQILDYCGQLWTTDWWCEVYPNDARAARAGMK